MMNHLPLNSYKFKKGKFISPLNELMTPLESHKSWTYGRLPEYIWIALILQKYGREDGFIKLFSIIEIIAKNTNLEHIRLSDFLKSDVIYKNVIFKALRDTVGEETISPLTAVITCTVDKEFSQTFISRIKLEQRIATLEACLGKFYDHQSEDATDVRYIVLSYALHLGRLHLQPQELELIKQYQNLSHCDVRMRKIRPSIRSTEQILLFQETPSLDYLNLFWSKFSELTECRLFMFKEKQEDRNTQDYYICVKRIIQYIKDVYIDNAPLEQKNKILFGIMTYSFKRLEEAEIHNLYNSISGRSIVRSLIENYIMMKYLIHLEKEKSNIWTEYEQYGIGQYKLVLSRHREEQNTRESHVNTDMLEFICNEFKIEEFTDMDTKYFNKDNIRIKAKEVNEPELYGLYYDYDSAYEHGLWGAIRESSLVKCDNPSHQYHCVPDLENKIILKSVFDDCVYVMNKTLLFINEHYSISDNLLMELKGWEND